MPVQTQYLDELRSGLPGQVVNTEPAVFVSRNVEGSAGLGFGRAGSQGDLDKGVVPFGVDATGFVGIAVRERSLDANTPDSFPEFASARLMTKGVIFVTAAVAVDAGDEVYVVPATGAFTNSSASDAVLIPRARWETSTTGEALAAVRLA